MAINERVLFEAALEFGDLKARQSFLEKACEGDASLKSRVEALLQSHETAKSFLETPAVDPLQPEAIEGTAKTVLGGPAEDDANTEDLELYLSFLQPSTKAGSMGALGHYEILQVLGNGGFGVVLKAFDEKLHRVVAIKVMNAQMAATSPPRKRFLREARSAAAVKHENIVQVYSVEESPVPYMAMEFIAGPTLQQFLDSHGPLETELAVSVAGQIAAGLAAAHAQGLIHRDIKPSNILLEEGIHQRVKITDFGLARAVDDASLTRSGVIAGTPMYMAPEQAMGQALDHRTDLFSLGSVMYQMACGRPPFRAPSTVAVLRRVAEDTPRPLQEILPQIPDWLVSIINRLLEKNPDERFQTANEVADLLAQCQIELKSSGRVTCVQSSHHAPRDEPPATAQSASSRPSPNPSTSPNAAVQPSTAARGSSRGAMTATLKRTLLFIGSILAIVAIIAVVINNRKNTPDLASGENPPSNPASEIALQKSKIENPVGWHGWPADAPAPAVAPFDAAQAKQHQEEWAAYLKLPVEYTNSIGMKFVLIPPGEFMMGSTAEEIEAALKNVGEHKHSQECIQSEAPQHNVILTQAIYMGINEVTQADYEKVMETNPSYFAAMGPGKEAVTDMDTTKHPVEMVSWNDVADFCAKLSQKEELKPFYFRAGAMITPLDGTDYRLPTEAEWEFACRAGTTTKYWIGDKDEDLVRAGWFEENSGSRTHAVGELKANPLGLSDIHGNVWEWVDDEWEPTYYGQFAKNPAINPDNSSSANYLRVARGGRWHDNASFCRSSDRKPLLQSVTRYDHLGFRVALAADAVKASLKRQSLPATVAKTGWPADAPAPAIAPFDAAQAKKHQEEWAAYLKLPVEYTNSIGMKFRLIPPGEFLMGSTAEEIEEALQFNDPNDPNWHVCVKSEAPQHKVILTRPFYIGVYEVTQAEYEEIVGVNPSHFSATGAGKDSVANLDVKRHPVEMVSWNDAAEFCTKLSQHEKLKPFYFRSGETVTPLSGTGCRLPTEAEWEFACRAGTTTKFWVGNTDEELMTSAWISTNSEARTHTVGELKPNPFDLFDVHGNVWEWVQDKWEEEYYAQFTVTPAVSPNGPFPGPSMRVLRGGVWYHPSSASSASSRHAFSPSGRLHLFGCRVVLTVDAVMEALKVDGPKTVKPGVPVGANGNPIAEQGRSAWDDLDAAQIPAAERVPGQPEGLVAVLGQHRRRVWSPPLSTAVSADGSQYLLTLFDGDSLHLFDRDSKKPARLFKLGNETHAATFLPDGRIAAFVSVTGTMQLQIFGKPRDGESLELQSTTNIDDGIGIHHTVSSSDGQWLAAFEYNLGGIVLWKLSGTPPQQFAKFKFRTRYANTPPLSFSPDANWFCFTDLSQDQSTIHLIDLRGDTPREAAVLKADADEESDAPTKGFWQGVFLADGRLATADRNGRTWFWKINDGEPQRAGSIRDSAATLCSSAKSLRLAILTGGRNGVWDLAVDPPRFLGSCSASFPADNIRSAAFAPDGETLFTAHLNGAVRFWNISTKGVTELDALIPNPKGPPPHGEVRVLGHFLCASQESLRTGIWRPTRDGLQPVPEESSSLLVWNASRAQRQLIVRESGNAGGTALLHFDTDHWTPSRRINGGGVRSTALNDAGHRLAIGRHNGTEEVLELWGWESEDAPARKLTEVKPSNEWIMQLAFAEGGRSLVSRHSPLGMRVWDVQDDQLVARGILPEDQYYQFAIAPDGVTLATVGDSGLRLWNLKSDIKKSSSEFAVGDSHAVAFSPDGKRLAAASGGTGYVTGVQTINLASGVVEKRLSFPGPVYQLDFTDDSRHLVTGNANGTIYVVRLADAPKSSIE